jgi:hypothetical protein
VNISFTTALRLHSVFGEDRRSRQLVCIWARKEFDGIGGKHCMADAKLWRLALAVSEPD